MDFSDYDLYLTRNGVSSHSTEGEWITEQTSPNHTETRWREWNEQNDGIGIALKQEKNDLVKSYLLGTYQNSINKQTNYAGMQWQKRFGNDDFHADIGLLAGLATGYQPQLTPMVLPTLSLGNKDMDFNLRYIPEIQGVTPSVITANFDYRLPK